VNVAFARHEHQHVARRRALEQLTDDVHRGVNGK
jgi:hypothetical protein